MYWHHQPWGSNWGSSVFCRPHAKTNTNALKIFAHHAVFCACLSSRSDRSRCRWHMHLMNHGYFDYWKTRRPQFEPHARIKMVQVLGSPVYIYATAPRQKGITDNFVKIELSPEDPNLSPMPESRCAGSGISSVYLCYCPTTKGHNWQFCQNWVITITRSRVTISISRNHKTPYFRLENPKNISSKNEFYVQVNGSQAQ